MLGVVRFLIRARRIGDFEDFPGQHVAALFARARVHVRKVLRSLSRNENPAQVQMGLRKFDGEINELGGTG
jgi:hypothetical protein